MDQANGENWRAGNPDKPSDLEQNVSESDICLFSSPDPNFLGGTEIGGRPVASVPHISSGLSVVIVPPCVLGPEHAPRLPWRLKAVLTHEQPDALVGLRRPCAAHKLGSFLLLFYGHLSGKSSSVGCPIED